MVKTSFKVHQPPIGTQIAAGLNKGLAEQIPKEVAQYRLSQGLQNFAQNAGNLSPLEAAAQLGGIPGISPQMLQILPELLKRQQYAQGLNAQNQSQKQPIPSGSLNAEGRMPQNLPIVEPEEVGQPQANPQSPFREQVTPRPIWTQERVNQERANVAGEMPWLTIPEINQEVQQREQRYQAEPESYKKIDDERRETSKRLQTGLDERLNLLLENSDPKTVGKISGELLNNLHRSAERDLISDPNASEEDIINHWAKKALDLDKARKRLEVLSKRGIVDRLTSPGKMEERLKEFQKIYAETGNEEEYANYLISDFGLSREGANSIAFPVSKRIADFATSKKFRGNIENVGKNSRAIATSIEDIITPKDSILAIAREMSLRNPFFDKQNFIDQLREDQDIIGLTPRQKRELAEGQGSILPSWGDIFNLSWSRKR